MQKVQKAARLMVRIRVRVIKRLDHVVNAHLGCYMKEVPVGNKRVFRVKTKNVEN